jgi:hypothetical protein
MRTQILALCVLAVGCSKHAAGPPETKDEAGARAVAEKLAAPGADLAALSKELRPTSADYAAVYEPAFAAELEKMYTPVWDSGQLVIGHHPGQTQVLLRIATAEEFKAGAAKGFPGGYRKVAEKLQPGVTLYAFDFVEPGKTLGMAYDGLVKVNGHFRIIPKPWRAVR